jgi:hypothetical protein
MTLTVTGHFLIGLLAQRGRLVVAINLAGAVRLKKLSDVY